jgi:thioredoxin-like negative regulator of GroEL
MYSQDVSQFDFEEKIAAVSHKQPVVIDFCASML